MLYLELPLRAGPFRAPLVYGRPETWDGFWYVVLAEQFQGSISDPFGNIGGKVLALITRATGQFGPLTVLIPVAFLATAVRRPRYALLTGTPAVITWFFAASYLNADIGRYYLVPWLMVWTWLAILRALRRLRSSPTWSPDRSDLRGRRPTPRFGAIGRGRGDRLAMVLLVARPLVAVAGPLPDGQRERRPGGEPLGGPGPGGDGPRMRSSSAGGATPRRYGMHSASRVDGRT